MRDSHLKSSNRGAYMFHPMSSNRRDVIYHPSYFLLIFPTITLNSHVVGQLHLEIEQDATYHKK